MIHPIRQLGVLRYALLCVAVVAQFATVLITWKIWLVRSPESGYPNLPLFDVPQVDFGIWVLLSVAAVLLFPRWGLWVHLAVLMVASLFDQMRTQPQLLAIWILMLAVIFPVGPRIARLFLTSLWFWAGLHKLLSPDWWTHCSWGLVADAGQDAETWHWWFAAVVAISEMLLGVLAWLKPRWAAIGCPLLHGGIAVFLSPLFCNWNVSVFPWNLATALIGSWLLWKFSQSPSSAGEHVAPLKFCTSARWEVAVLIILLVLPAGFYVGCVDHGYAHVLYSDHLPRGLITLLDGQSREITGWGSLNAPCPKERRLLKQHFLLTSVPGEKLHLSDPRTRLPDQFFLRTKNGMRELTPAEFFSEMKGEPIGVAADPRATVFILADAGVRMLMRSKHEMIYAVEIAPTKYSPAVLALAATLHNLEEIQLSGTAVTDDDLDCLLELPLLRGIGLNDTAITAKGKAKLESMPSMKKVHWDGPFDDHPHPLPNPSR